MVDRALVIAVQSLLLELVVPFSMTEPVWSDHWASQMEAPVETAWFTRKEATLIAELT